jgi:hypothetical protein
MNHIIVKTAESAIKQDKNGRNYKTVTFTERTMLNTQFGPMPKPLSQCRSTSVNQYELNYLGQPDPGYSAPIFNERNPQAGGYFEGKIENRNVREYDIESKDGGIRAVNTYTTVVFGDTASPAWESTVKSAFKSRGHEVVEPVNTTVVSQVEEAPVF